MSLFYGAVSARADAGIAAPSAASLRCKEFSGGRLAYDEAVAVHEHDGDLCVAMGRPRFLDGTHAEQARSMNAAAAWITAFNALGAKAPSSVADRFAVVLIRPQSRTVIFATDRFGTHPLCYAERDGELFFSNRADAVPGRWPVSPQQIFSYLAFHVVPTPFTIFEGVHRVLPGHLVTWQDGRTESHRYWQPTFDERGGQSLEDAKRTFRDLVRDAVAREAADGEVGAFLSGGTDSSTISGMLSEASKGAPPKTYSIGFDVAGYDEMEYARIAARHFKTDHHEYYVGPDDLEAGIGRIAAHFDQPFGNSSAVPTLICAGRAKADGVERLLAGDGGDEFFGGNTRYAKQRVFGWYQSLPGAARSTIVEPLVGLPLFRLPGLKKAASYVEQARIPMPDRTHTYNLLRRLGLDRVFEPAFLAGVEADAPFEQQRRWWASAECGSDINQMLAFDWKYTLTDSDLPKVVGATECADVGVAFPFLSQELVDFSLQLPPQWKLKGLTLRWFFKEALRDFLPAEIIKKQKHGFGLPFGTWACRHEGLKRLSSETLGSFEQRGIVRPGFIRQLLEQDLPAHPGYYGEMVWILMMLELWLQRQASDFRMVS